MTDEQFFRPSVTRILQSEEAVYGLILVSGMIVVSHSIVGTSINAFVTVVVTVINQPPAQAEATNAGCDASFGGCGVGFFPGYTYYAPPYQRGFHKPHRGKWPTTTPARQNWQIPPPLIPSPTTQVIGGRRLG